jgi:hypothetical protein
MRSTSHLAIFAIALILGGGACVAAAAGAAGAVGGVYYSDRGAESVVKASVERTVEATRQAFKELNIGETKASNEQKGAKAKSVLEGKTPDREVTVSITTEGEGSKVEVVARKSAVTWDKDFAKTILQRVVALAS